MFEKFLQKVTAGSEMTPQQKRESQSRSDSIKKLESFGITMEMLKQRSDDFMVSARSVDPVVSDNWNVRNMLQQEYVGKIDGESVYVVAVDSIDSVEPQKKHFTIKQASVNGKNLEGSEAQELYEKVSALAEVMNESEGPDVMHNDINLQDGSQTYKP